MCAGNYRAAVRKHQLDEIVCVEFGKGWKDIRRENKKETMKNLELLGGIHSFE